MLPTIMTLTLIGAIWAYALTTIIKATLELRHHPKPPQRPTTGPETRQLEI